MAAKFELKAAKGGKFVFNLKATNGQVMQVERNLRIEVSRGERD